MSLTKLALRRMVSVIICIGALIVFGLGSVFTSPMELTPNIEMPMLIVITTYPGAGPEDVESLVTSEIEDAVSTLSGLENVQSQSQENLSLVMLELEYGTDMDRAHMDLQENLNTYASSLPDTASDPIIVEISMDAMATVTLSASGEGSAADLLNRVNDEIAPEFERLSGVASVDVAGGEEEYISVELQEEKLNQYGLTMSTVTSLISTADFSLPAGEATLGSQNLTVHGAVNYDTAESLGQIPLFLATGDVIHLSDVANIHYGTQDATSVSRYNGNPTVSLSITKRQSASTVDVADSVIATMEQLNSENSGITLEVISDQSELIRSAVSSVIETLLLGILLSMIVLFFFFGDLKASCIVGSSMPISVLATFILMRLMSFSLNLLSLGGLVIGVGMMVDNSIVVIESCFRVRAEGRPFEEAALEGTKVVSASIVASTITTVVVFLPLSVMEGLTGQLFQQLGFTIIFSLLTSLVSALMLVPLFFSRLKPLEHQNAPMNRILPRVEAAYGRVLRRILRHPRLVVLVSVGLLVLSFAILSLVNVELIPTVDEGTVLVSLETRPGLSLDEVDQKLLQLEEMVASHPDVERYSTQSGSSMLGSNSSTVTAYLRDDREMTTAQVVEQWQNETRNMVDGDVTVSSSSSAMGSMMSGSGTVSISLQSIDLDDLSTAAAQVEEVMQANPNILNISSTLSGGGPQAEIVIDPLKAAAAGITPMEAASAVRTMRVGTEVMTLRENGQEYSVMVEYPPDRFETMEQISGMMLTSSAGRLIPLTDIATIEYTDSPQQISRKNGQYIVTITGQPAEAARYTAAEEVDAAIAQLTFPAGVEQTASEIDEAMNEEFSALGMAIVVALLLVFMVMAMQFESARFSALVMICVPFSLIGSFSLLFFSGSTLSMVSLMGVLMLIGIVVNNGILFIDTTNQLRSSMDAPTALVTAGQTRLRPILMTTLTTILSMVPMALGVGENTEIMQGMAVVIIGGLTASTLLTLLLLPTFYLMFGQTKAQRDSMPPPPPQPEPQPDELIRSLNDSGADTGLPPSDPPVLPSREEPVTQ
ncbi:MAG TPA: efflux RND transporter permease subunit [Firmicutes bacterium]|nr:efflux RND transporter permease subunit [Bacillota bacterium]